MSGLRDARRALPLTFAIYVLHALVATFVALPTSVALLDRVRPSSSAPSDVAVLLESGDSLEPLLHASTLDLVLAALALLLLSPWLHMSWCVALTSSTSTLGALERGASLAGRAWLVSLAVGLIALLAALPFGCGAYVLHLHYEAATEAKVHDLAVAAALIPLLPCAFVASVLHDLARVSALSRGAIASVRRSLRMARPRLLALALALSALGWAIVALSHALVAPLGSGPIALVLTVTLLQLALLAKLVVRSAWLACAHARIGPVASDPRWPNSIEDEA